MMGETSGPSAQDIRMASFEEKFNDLLNFVRLLVKRDTESEKQVEDIDKGTSEDNTGGHSDTNLGPPPVQPSKPEERDFQLDAKVEKTMRSTKMVDASALLALAKPDVENEARTVDPNVAPENDPSPKGNWNTLEGPSVSTNVWQWRRELKESEKEAQSPISKKEEPKEVDHPMIPHKRYTPKNVVERVEQLEKRLDEVKDTEGKETLMLHTGRYQSSRNLSSSAKLKSELRKFCTLPMPMDELYPRPGHSLEDCHALKNKVQDLVDHGILRINEGSTPSVIIAWPPEHCKDETVIPSPQSQRAHYLWHSASSFDHATNTLRDDQCSSDKEKAEYRTSRCMTLKRKIQGLGHSEPDVPFMVQARKPSMHTVPMKKARSTLGFRRQWAIKRSDRANHSKEHRSLDPASPRMSSQDLDITTTEEEEVHTKRTDPPPAGDIHTTHGRQSTREPLRFNHDPTNFPISMFSENWKEISHHRHTQQTWRSILRQISRSLKIYIIQANGHLLQNLPNR
uniref:Uncharacterized protein n=2 Tax=Fagus sylvatica TaxID=28930 RepID=A0A2N9GK78_FAGSY